MEGMDTADDGFIQTKVRNQAEEGAFISLSMESNQEKLERNIRLERYMDGEN